MAKKSRQCDRSIRRIFSEALKKKIVKDIQSGKVSVSAVCREYEVSNCSVYKWLKKFSTNYQSQKTIIVQMKSEQYKSKELAQKVKELEAIIGRKQMELDYLNKLIELAGEELKVDLKKSFNGKPSDGLKGQVGS